MHIRLDFLAQQLNVDPKYHPPHPSTLSLSPISVLLLGCVVSYILPPACLLCSLSVQIQPSFLWLITQASHLSVEFPRLGSGCPLLARHPACHWQDCKDSLPEMPFLQGGGWSRISRKRTRKGRTRLVTPGEPKNTVPDLLHRTMWTMCGAHVTSIKDKVDKVPES